MRLTALVGCYGGWPEYSIRAVESLLRHCVARERLDVFVGCNECSPEILTGELAGELGSRGTGVRELGSRELGELGSGDKKEQNPDFNSSQTHQLTRRSTSGIFSA